MAGRNKTAGHQGDKPEPASPAAEPSAIEKFQPGLYRFLIRRLRRSEDARDLAQDTYLRFLQVAQHELVRQPQAYLYRIAANLVSEFSLREKRAPMTYDPQTLHELAEHPDDIWNDDPGDRLGREQEVEQLERIARQLPAAYQAVLVLRVRDGLSREEIAKTLNLSPQTVKKYLFRALAHCRGAQWER